MRWIKWIISVISDPTYAFSINGKLSRWIKAAVGIRQGCPLSPYLFTICSPTLSRKMNLESRSGTFEALQLAPGTAPLTHLFFADDIVIFSQASTSSCEALNFILGDYCSLSGQVMNRDKCKLVISKGASLEVRSRVETIFGFRIADEMGFHLLDGAFLLRKGNRKCITSFILPRLLLES